MAEHAVAAAPGAGPTIYSNLWNFGFNLQWELDFWGQLRRAITAADANLDASVAGYDEAMVTMLADIAQNYVQIRTDQERIALLRDSVKIQQGVFNYIAARFEAGYKVSKLDYAQALANLRQTEAQILPLEIDLSPEFQQPLHAAGHPRGRLAGAVGRESTFPPRRRKWPWASPPNWSAAGRTCGRPSALPRPRPSRSASPRPNSIRSSPSTARWTGRRRRFAGLFSGKAFNGAIGPQFQWNILNYGRIRSNMIYQDALFKQLVVAYQAQVLQASQDAENGIVTFLRSQVETRLLQESVKAGREAVRIVILQYKAGAVDFNRYATIVQALIPQQDSMAQAQGQIAQGLIQILSRDGRGLGDSRPVHAALPRSVLLPATDSAAFVCPAGTDAGVDSDAAVAADAERASRLAARIGAGRQAVADCRFGGRKAATPGGTRRLGQARPDAQRLFHSLGVQWK